jgi:hypothetical protein
MIRGSFSTSQPLRSKVSRSTGSTDLAAMITYGVRQAFTAASVTKNAARFAIFEARLWHSSRRIQRKRTRHPSNVTTAPNMNTTLKTETAQSPKVTTPQKPSGDSAPQKPPVDPATHYSFRETCAGDHLSWRSVGCSLVGIPRPRVDQRGSLRRRAGAFPQDHRLDVMSFL